MSLPLFHPPTAPNALTEPNAQEHKHAKVQAPTQENSSNDHDDPHEKLMEELMRKIKQSETGS